MHNETIVQIILSRPHALKNYLILLLTMSRPHIPVPTGTLNFDGFIRLGLDLDVVIMVIICNLYIRIVALYCCIDAFVSPCVV